LHKKPLIGITLGDPNGIGPEIVAKALRRPRIQRLARFRIISGMPDDLAPPQGRRSPGPTAASGRAAVRAVLRAIDLALKGEIDAIVTAPLSKEAIRMAGYSWPGHTEILADRTGTRHPVMTMVGGRLIAALVTTHVSMRDLPNRITKDKVLTTIRVLHEGLRRYWRIKRPRIAVCGLNPHAGEGGLFGREDIGQILPAVRRARRDGIQCVGPLPADVLFHKAHNGEYDGVVAMYHDQANIPVKMLGFESGVNVTLGLPIIRTSPDHGTAYDIAWKGRADPGSMIAAIELAVRMAKRK
jgi:4-hydroxythreonine-4-phosphate dehydrogenase